MSEQPTPRTDAKFDLRNEMREAREFVNSSPLFRRFIDGTPLENDVACWIANAVIEKKDFVRGLERELAEARESRDGSNSAMRLALISAAKNADERDQWREVADRLASEFCHSLTCSDLHHGYKDRHDYNEACPVVQRRGEIMQEYQELKAKYI